MDNRLRTIVTAIMAAAVMGFAAVAERPPSQTGTESAAAFTVGCVNCGAFHYGNGRASAEDFAAAWSRMAAEWPQDVFFYEDVGRTRKPGDTAVPGLDIRAATRRRPLACDIVKLPRSIESEAGEQKSPRYRALRLVYEVEGKKVAVYGVHLVAEGHLRGPKPAKGKLSLSQKLRQRQFKALMEDARKFDHAILTGDFNAQKPHEYGVFTDAGYSIANCSPRYGVKATLRNIPADNIIISAGLSFADFKVLDGYVLDTDHRPLVARVLFTPPPPLPSVAEFLEKPADERRALFRNPEFRLKMVKSNYPDGPGLLSRWVRVENIPNLRDVGGIVNKAGQELRRGVFYRSAGWNDNAKFDKKKPETEWKKGKCRLTESGRKIALEQMRLKTDLDLRSDPECWGMTGSPIGGGVVWRHVSFGNYDDFEKSQKWRDAVKEAFITLADPESRPLVFHCIGGADRTGSLAYFIQAICDVDDETLLKDWELTCCYVDRPQFMHDVCIDKMVAMLAKYPGGNTAERVRSFLRSCGVTDAEMDSVRSALLGGASAAKKPAPPLPTPTFDSVAYGEHPMQKMDVWLPEKGAPTPAIIFVHGGGFRNGDRKDPRLGERIPKCRAARVALISVEYRLLKDAGDVKPPVRVCMDDVVAAIRFVRSKAAEWRIDTSRIGLTGSSAGAHAVLYASLTGDNEFGIRAVYTQYPQTSIDPKEMREWIPNSKYGAHLFGYPDFQTWLDHRDEVLPWIEKFSPAGLLRRCTPSRAPAFVHDGPAAPKPGELPKDPTHSGTFRVKFSEICAARGISCRFGHHDALITLLTQDSSKGGKEGK